jgi:hypothetical protein
MAWVATLLGSTLKSPDNTGPGPSRGPSGLGGMMNFPSSSQPVQLAPGGLGNAGLAALGNVTTPGVSVLPPTGSDGLQQDILAQQNMAQQQQNDPNSIGSLLGNLAMSTMRGPSSAAGVVGNGPSGRMTSTKLQVDPATGQLKWVTM